MKKRELIFWSKYYLTPMRSFYICTKSVGVLTKESYMVSKAIAASTSQVPISCKLNKKFMLQNYLYDQFPLLDFHSFIGHAWILNLYMYFIFSTSMAHFHFLQSLFIWRPSTAYSYCSIPGDSCFRVLKPNHLPMKLDVIFWQWTWTEVWSMHWLV